MDIVIDNSLFTVKIGGSGDRHDHWILITTKTITPMAAPRTNRPFTTGFHLKPLPPGNAFLPF